MEIVRVAASCTGAPALRAELLIQPFDWGVFPRRIVAQAFKSVSSSSFASSFSIFGKLLIKESTRMRGLSSVSLFAIGRFLECFRSDSPLRRFCFWLRSERSSSMPMRAARPSEFDRPPSINILLDAFRFSDSRGRASERATGQGDLLPSVCRVALGRVGDCHLQFLHRGVFQIPPAGRGEARALEPVSGTAFAHPVLFRGQCFALQCACGRARRERP